jgi:hypothetical protein
MRAQNVYRSTRHILLVQDGVRLQKFYHNLVYLFPKWPIINPCLGSILNDRWSKTELLMVIP